MLGWEPEELIGRASAEFVLPEDHRRRMAVHRHPSALQSSTDEVRCRRSDGRLLWVSARLREVREDGRLVNVVVSVRDVHKQVQARQAMQASEARFRMLAENVSDVVYQVVDDRIVWISPSVERLLGWRPEDLVGRPSFDLIAPEDLERCAVARAGVVADRPLEGFECRFLTVDGSRRWMVAHARRIEAEGCDYGLVAGLQDIHEGHASRMALAALAAVNSALVGAGDEAELLADVCRLLVDEGGFATARFRHADDHSVRAPTPGSRAAVDLPVSVDGRVDGTLVVGSEEPDAFSPAVESTLLQLAHQVGMAISRVRTREQLVAALNEQVLLSTAIEQAGEIGRRDGYRRPDPLRQPGHGRHERVLARRDRRVEPDPVRQRRARARVLRAHRSRPGRRGHVAGRGGQPDQGRPALRGGCHRHTGPGGRRGRQLLRRRLGATSAVSAGSSPTSTGSATTGTPSCG